MTTNSNHRELVEIDACDSGAYPSATDGSDWYLDLDTGTAVEQPCD